MKKEIPNRMPRHAFEYCNENQYCVTLYSIKNEKSPASMCNFRGNKTNKHQMNKGDKFIASKSSMAHLNHTSVCTQRYFNNKRFAAQIYYQ